MIEQVILVDANDRALGVEEKLKAHREGKLHRAFSIFLFNSKNELLLQRRALEKYHCGGLWANTCCGHPRPHETLAAAAARRLHEEMGIRCPIRKIFAFTYRAELNGGLIEHEFDHVFVGRYDGATRPNQAEVMAERWLSFNEVRYQLRHFPEAFAPWLGLALRGFDDFHAGALTPEIRA